VSNLSAISPLIANEQGKDRKSGTAGSRGTLCLIRKRLHAVLRVRFKQFYNVDDLRLLKNSRPFGFRSKYASLYDRVYARREEYNLASPGPFAGGKLRGMVTAGSRGHSEIDVCKTSAARIDEQWADMGRGPGRLTKALLVDLRYDGLDLWSASSSLCWL
jgi:hypothetical protein